MEDHGELHFPSDLYASIQKVTLDDIPDHDILTAGFPCQPYTAQAASSSAQSSGSSRRPRGFRDPRGQLFWHVIRFLRARQDEPHRQPKVILLETVPGLLKNDVTR